MDEVRLVVTGSGAVGKTALVLRFISGVYEDSWDPTIEDSYNRVVTVDEKQIRLEILDTAGQEEFSSLRDQWFREGECMLVVYDVQNKGTFENADFLIQQIQRVRDLDSFATLPVILVAGKCDVSVERRQVSADEGRDYAKKLGISFFEVSAKEKIRNEDIFIEAARQVIKIRTEVGLDKDIDIGGDNRFNCCVSVSSICSSIHLSDVKIPLSTIASPTSDTEEVMKAETISLGGGMTAIRLNPVKAENDTNSAEIPPPVLVLKNFEMSRNFYWKRFFGSLLLGLFLPITLIIQIIPFLIYNDQRSPWYYPRYFMYNNIHESWVLDILGLVVGRDKQDPEMVKDRRWFLRQSGRQIFFRICLSLFLIFIYFIAVYNAIIDASKYNSTNEVVSKMESIGPVLLCALLWVLFSFWVALELDIPPLPSFSRLRSIYIYFGEKFGHCLSAYTFLRSYARTRQENSSRSVSITTIVVISVLSFFYALMPGMIRVSFLDASFFPKDDFLVTFGALLANLSLIASFLYGLEREYSNNFSVYIDWMRDLTFLLSRSSNIRNHSAVDTADGEESNQIDNVSSLFISLKKRSNVLGWLELRSFLAIEGQKLHGEQELPTVWLVLVTICEAVFILWRVYFVSGAAYESILFNGICILFLVCLVSLIRIAMAGRELELLQSEQERLISEQKFFMRCNFATDFSDLSIINQSSNGDTTITEINNNSVARITNAIRNANALRKRVSLVSKNTKAGNNGLSGEAEEKLQVTLDMNDLSMLDDHEMWKSTIVGVESVVGNRLMNSYQLGFIDDMINIVKTKPITPNLFGIPVTGVLLKTISSVVLSMIVTLFGVLLPN